MLTEVDVPAAYDRPVKTEWKILAKIRVESPEISLADIAKRIGYNQGTVYRWLKTPEYQRYESWLVDKTYALLPSEVRMSREELQEKISDYADDMLSRLVHICETTESEKLQVEIAQDFLDRAGHAARLKDSSRGVTLHLTADAIAILVKRQNEIEQGEQLLITP